MSPGVHDGERCARDIQRGDERPGKIIVVPHRRLVGRGAVVLCRR